VAPATNPSVVVSAASCTRPGPANDLASWNYEVKSSPASRQSSVEVRAVPPLSELAVKEMVKVAEAKLMKVG
jgi:hypothetical protein